MMSPQNPSRSEGTAGHVLIASLVAWAWGKENAKGVKMILQPVSLAGIRPIGMLSIKPNLDPAAAFTDTHL